MRVCFSITKYETRQRTKKSKQAERKKILFWYLYT